MGSGGQPPPPHVCTLYCLLEERCSRTRRQRWTAHPSGASTVVDGSCQKGGGEEEEGHGPRVWQKRKEQKKQKKKQSQTPSPVTAEKNKIKQPHIRLALSRAGTLTAMDSAPKRKRSGITPDSCGKAGVVTLTTWRVERLRLATLPSL